MKKILVTGAEGFIGKNLVNYLKNSFYEVIYPTQDQLDLADSVAVKFFLIIIIILIALFIVQQVKS